MSVAAAAAVARVGAHRPHKLEVGFRPFVQVHVRRSHRHARVVHAARYAALRHYLISIDAGDLDPLCVCIYMIYLLDCVCVCVCVDGA